VPSLSLRTTAHDRHSKSTTTWRLVPTLTRCRVALHGLTSFWLLLGTYEVSFVPKVNGEHALELFYLQQRVTRTVFEVHQGMFALFAAA